MINLFAMQQNIWSSQKTDLISLKIELEKDIFLNQTYLSNIQNIFVLSWINIYDFTQQIIIMYFINQFPLIVKVESLINMRFEYEAPHKVSAGLIHWVSRVFLILWYIRF